VHVTTVRVNTGDQPIERATIVAEEMHRWYRDSDGFLGMLFLSREGTTLVLTFWESPEVAAGHEATRAEFRQRASEIAGVTIEEVSDFQVMFADLGGVAAS
jgi:heme-degrading monooxygenase HmoA